MDKNETKVKVTIIIPHFNTPNYLRKLLDTIPCIDCIQVLVIDDKSTMKQDKYEELHREEKYSHVQFINNTTDKKGAGVCRNIGLEQALGKWLVFADADDYFTEKLYSKLEKYLESDKDVIFFPPTSVDLETNKSSCRHERTRNIIYDFLALPNKENELQVKYKLYEPWSKLISRELIIDNEIAFDPVPVANDVMFTTKMAYHMNTFQIAKDVIYCATNNAGSLTKVLSEENYNIRLSVFINQYKFLEGRLSRKDFKILNLNAMMFIKWIISYKLGLKKLFWLRTQLRKNNIKWVVNIRILKPSQIAKEAIMSYQRYRASKRHYMIK